MAPLIPTLAAHARSLLSSAATTRQAASDRLAHLGPLGVRAILAGRDDNNKNSGPQLDPSAGVTDPNDINNTFVFVVFGLIGVAFVVTGIWFFFWARNGGFHFKQNDWDDYKSTVLRRKGPNGTLLSGATPSTNLGGGSIYKDVDDGGFDARTEYTGGLTQMTGDTGDTVSTLTGITAGASDIAGREKRRRAREKKEREREKRRDRKKRGSAANNNDGDAAGGGGGGGGSSSRRKVGEDGVMVDEQAEADAKRNLRAYRSERPARVGGLNRAADGSEWDGSTNPEMSTVSGGSESLLYNRQSTPTSTPTKDRQQKHRSSRSGGGEQHHYYYDNATEITASDATTGTTVTNDTQSQAMKSNVSGGAGAGAGAGAGRKAGGIRKVYSTADRTSTRENERLRRMAKEERNQRRQEQQHQQQQYSSSSVVSSASLRRDYSFQRAGLRGGAGGSSHYNNSNQSNSVITEEAGESEMTSNPSAPLIGAHRYLPAPESSSYSASASWAAESDIADGSDLGTKSYRHYIPGISSEPEVADVPPLSTIAESAVGSSSEVSEDRRERRRWREARRSGMK